MSDGGRGRASLGVEVWKSSQKWRAQRSDVRSIAWLDVLGLFSTAQTESDGYANPSRSTMGEAPLTQSLLRRKLEHWIPRTPNDLDFADCAIGPETHFEHHTAFHALPSCFIRVIRACEIEQVERNGKTGHRNRLNRRVIVPINSAITYEKRRQCDDRARRACSARCKQRGKQHNCDARHTSNENKMSDGWRESASLRIEGGILSRTRNQSCQPFAPSSG